MEYDAGGSVPQWQCFGCDHNTLVISARIGDWGICPTCVLRHDASPAFRSNLAAKVTRANTALLAELLGVTTQQFMEAAHACGPNVGAFKAYLTARGH